VRLVFFGLIVDLFVDSGFLVAAFNSRGAGQSGGRSSASAHIHMEDYESIIEHLMKEAEDHNSTVSQLYICVCL